MNKAIVLGVETSDILCSVAWWQDNQTLLDYNIELANAHATLLAGLVAQGQKRLGLAASDISLVTVGSGPGSFTGLRIGMAFAKGFCYGLDIPVIDVTNFEVLAAQAQPDIFPVITLIEARKDHYYTGVFLENRTILDEKLLLSRKSIEENYSTDGQIVIHEKITTGYFSDNYAGSLPVTHGKYSAATICDLGYHKFSGNDIRELDAIEPLYLQSFAGVL